MKHAFLITAYKDPEQLTALIKRLASPQSFIFVHIDKKSSLNADELKKSFSGIKQLEFIEHPIKVYWGGFSHLQSFLMLMEIAFKKCDADYFHTISGQDYPIFSLNKFDEIISKHGKKEFLSCAKLEDLNWTGGSFSRLFYYHLNDWFNIRVRFWKRINSRFLQLQRIFKVKRKLPKNFNAWYGGGTWWSLSRDAIQYILNFNRENPSFLKSFRYTHCSEEIFFQTVLMNSAFAEKVAGNDLRFVDWEFRNGSVPAVLDENDFEKIISSGKLFARKTDSGVSDALCKKLDQSAGVF